MKKTFKQLTSFALAGVMMLSAAPVLAAAPQNASDNMTRQKAGEAADHVIQFDLPTALANTEEIVITFPNAAGEFTGTAVPTGAGWAAGPGANQVTYTSTGDAGGTTYNVTVAGLTNPTTVANYSITIVADNGDTGSILVPIIADDQIQITARVAQVLTFDVRDGSGPANTATDNAVGFGDLESGNTNFATDDATGSTTTAEASQFLVGTNAPGGYIVELAGETLTSMQNAANTIDPVVNGTAAPAAGTEAFGVQIAKEVANTGASVSAIATNYDGSYALPATATEDVVVTQAGPSSEEIFDVTYIANIDALTEAGDYSTVMTFTATANF